MKTIVLTGGGSAGHVIPHLALLPLLRQRFDRIVYIGGHTGIEKDIISKQAGVEYYGVTAAKLRRKLTLKNLAVPYKAVKGICEAKRLLKQIKPDVVFSKGGFVAVPAVFAAARLKIPVVAHESDYTAGLANRLTCRKCRAVCATFEDTVKLIKANGRFTGAPIRKELYKGDKAAVMKRHGFAGGKPVLLVMGGSLGAKAINAALRANLKEFCADYDIIHICGRGNSQPFGPLPAVPMATPPPLTADHYIQYEFTEDVAGLFAAADVVISRAGSGSVFELLALKKPMLLIPLPKAESRGDQLLNAEYFCKRGIARVLRQENMTGKTLKAAADKLYQERQKLIDNMSKEKNADGTENIFKVICEFS